MSGGIDSSVAAYLLQKEGYTVTGVTFTAFQEEGYKKCCSIEEITQAKLICKFLGVPHKIIDVKDVFQARVVKAFIDGYKDGKTPNPCVFCNRFVKFGALLEYAIAEGADLFATGHYAKLVETEGELLIGRGSDEAKDQSYFLSFIEQEKLPFIKLPLGGYKKPEIRQIALDAGLPIHPHKSESQDICFIKDDYRDFLELQGVAESPGQFIFHNKPVGKHRGIPFYSYGQRRGLNVAIGERVFIREFDKEKNRILLGDKPLSSRFKIGKINRFSSRFTDGEYMIQVRYQSRFIKGKVEFRDGAAQVELTEPQEIVSPGQFAVFYRADLVFGSGIIESVELV